MSFPIRVLAINSKTEDFPTPVSPTRRMVYGEFALFFDALMIPFLRDSTSLENTVRTDAPTACYVLLDVILAIVFQRVLAWASGSIFGRDFVTEGHPSQ